MEFGKYTNVCTFCHETKHYYFLGMKCHECLYEDGVDVLRDM